MANVITDLIPEVWSARMEVPLRKTLVAANIASYELDSELKVGDVIHKPYVSADATAIAYVPGTTVTIQEFTATTDDVTADTKLIVPFYVDDINELFAKADYAGQLADNAAYKLRDAIDIAVFDEVTKAAVTVGVDTTANHIGTAAIGTAVTVGTANVVELFSYCRKILRKQNVEEAGDWIAVVTPDVASIIEQMAAGAGFNVADATLRGGYAGSFLGFNIYVSNNLATANVTSSQSSLYIGKTGAIDLIMQSPPKMVIKDVDNQLGRNFLPYTVFGTGLTTENAKRFLCIEANV